MSGSDQKSPVFLFLQGPLSSFYSQIADHLIQNGAIVHKINFCGNDIMDWRHKGALTYRGTLEDWPSYLTETATQLGVTHLLMHGDRRPYHKPAVEWAAENGITVYVTELGYLRPDWITIEPWGTSTLSHFPKDPTVISKIAKDLPSFDRSRKYPDSIWAIIHQEIRWTVFNLIFKWKFPHFQTHRSQSPWIVYSGWLLSKLRAVFFKRITVRMLPSDVPFYVMALQLEGDFQLRDHSPFNSMAEGVEHVVASFAKYAPNNAQLVLKTHPHEFNGRQLRRKVEKILTDYNVSPRVSMIENVPIGELCAKAAGFVTVNSSAGFEALDVGCPTCTITPTIYDIDGITHQGHINEFWQGASPPSLKLLENLRRALTDTIQVRGTLYDKMGKRAGAHAVATVLEKI